MTLFIDTSALVRCYLRDIRSDAVVAAMQADETWVCSELARTEAHLVLHRGASSATHLDQLWGALRADLEQCYIVPVDTECLGLAIEIGATHNVGTAASIQLAAASRLPGPVTFLTCDDDHLAASSIRGMRLHLVSTQTASTPAASTQTAR